jgi:surface polysaccharide O-acyltransferase-like enzyme
MFLLALNNYKKDTLNKVIIKFSDLSLGVYLIHGIFLDITVKMLRYYSINSLFGIPIYSLIIFICSIISVYILRKIKILNKII